MADVALIYMPYGPIERPSLALSMFKPALEQLGISVDIRHLTFPFAERIGSRLYSELSWVREEMVAEWTFAGAAFPEHQPDQKAYLARVARTLAPGDEAGARIWLEGILSAREEANSFVEKAAAELAATHPRIVACSSTFNQHCASLALIRAMKRLLPGVVTIAGGANCDGEMGPATMALCADLDYDVSGEADVVFPELCRRILDQSDATVPVAMEAAGLYARQPSGEVTGTGRAQFDALDELPMPDFDTYFRDLRGYASSALVQPALLIETSRGCWWGQVHHCTFCGLNGGGMEYRRKSPGRALEEFSALAERYDLHRLLVVDNILDQSYYKSVLPALASLDNKLNLMFEIKSNVKFWHMQALRDAGVIWIQPGIESMHDEILRLMNKGVTALINTQVLRWARQLGQRVMWNFLCGFPGEQDDSYFVMAAWMPLIEHLEPPKDVRPIRYDRFSPYHSQAGKYGLNLQPSWPYEYIYPGPDSVRAGIAYIFDKADSPVDSAPGGDLLPSASRPLGGPGREALREYVLSWRARFESEAKPVLIAEKSAEETRITDTRSIAPAREAVLRGLEHRVHHLLEDPQTFDQLRALLEADDGWAGSEDEIRAVLTRLGERRLIHCFGNRYMALALPAAPPPAIGDSRDKGYPAGWVTHESLGTNARRSFRALDRELAKVELAESMA